MSMFKDLERFSRDQNCAYRICSRDLHNIILTEFKLTSSTKGKQELFEIVKAVMDDWKQLHAFCARVEKSFVPLHHEINSPVISNCRKIIEQAYSLYSVGLNAINPQVPFHQRDIINNDVMRMEIFLDAYKKIAGLSISQTLISYVLKPCFFKKIANPLARDISAIVGEFKPINDSIARKNQLIQYDDELRASGHRV